MTSKPRENRVEKILDALKKAASGNYSAKLDFASQDDDLSVIADAVNTLLQKTDQMVRSTGQTSTDLTEDTRRYRHILDSIEESYFEVDLKGNLVFFNDKVIRDLGYSQEELRGVHFHKLVDETNAGKVYDVFHQVFLTGRPIQGFDWEILKKNKEKVDVESSVTLLRDKTGKPAGFRGVVRNVSQRIQAQEQLRQSEEKYRHILENMEETYLETDLKGNFLFFNDSLCRLLGYSRTELAQMGYRNCIAPEMIPVIFQIFNEIYRTDQPKRFVNQELIAKNGSTIIVEVSVSLRRGPNGEPTGFQGIARDVTEKIKAERSIQDREKHLRLITDNIRDIIWTMDFHLQWTYLSPSVLRITGFLPEEVMKIPLKAVVPSDTYAFLERILQEELFRETGEPIPDEQRITTFEIPLIHKNGKPLWVEISADFSRDENGKPLEIVGVTRDISERKKAEEALKESEKRYRMIVENMHDSISILDLNFQYLYQSPSEIRVTGFTPEEIMKIPIRDQMTPESYDLAEETLARELELEYSGKPVDPNRLINLELEVYHKNGGTLWEEVNAVFQRDKNGRPTGIVLTSRDITSRKRAEMALAESEKRYRNMAENINDIIWTIDLNLQFNYISPSCMQVTGYTPEEARLTPMNKLLTPESFAHATGRLADEIAFEKSGKPFDPHRAITIEIEAIHRRGHPIYLEITGTFNRNDQGEIAEILIVGRDITERKKAERDLEDSEKRYRMIIENMHEVVWTMDLNLQYTYFSPSCLFLTGHRPEELMKLRIDQVVTPESVALAAKEFSQQLEMESSDVMADPHRIITIEQEVYHKNGGTIVLEVTATFTRDENGKATGLLMAGRDITARKKAEAEKDKLEEQLIQAQKMEIVGRLAGGVAHDFNNMLSVILGYADLAKMRLARQHPVLVDIAEIEKAAIRSRDITNQLLAFSRKQIIEPKIIDLNDLVTHTQKALIRLIGEDIVLKVSLEQNLWPIKFDPSQVEQILINLAVNARDAMPDGGRLTIETTNFMLDALYCENHAGFTPGDYVRLSFSDNGMGMNNETLQHIFEPFFTTKQVGKGTGLGLSTVYGIVKQNNGLINVYSEPDHGTTFSIYVPRTSEERVVHDQSAEEPERTGTGNILLVEDDAMVLQITKSMLESIGYKVMTALNPLDALSLCRDPATRIDLVISDVVMPGLSGKDLRDRLVDIRPDIKVLFMSGYTADVIAHHGILEEGVHFLQKPFTIKSLSGKVRDLMAKSP